MDTDATKKQLENDLAVIEAYLDHPISREILKDNDEQQRGLIEVICDLPVVNIETFFAHFSAVGELRGLRRARVSLEGKADDIREQLKELEYATRD